MGFSSDLRKLNNSALGSPPPRPTLLIYTAGLVTRQQQMYSLAEFHKLPIAGSSHIYPTIGIKVQGI